MTDIKFFTILMAILILVGSGLIYGAFLYEKAKCFAKYERAYSPVEFGFFEGCMATFNDKIIPVERIREESK